MTNVEESFEEFPILFCPKCEEASPLGEWSDCEVGCELCGTHDGVKCPKCGESFEHVWGYDQIRDAQSKINLSK